MEAYDYDTAQLIDEKTIIVQVGHFKFTSGYRASKMIKPRYIKGEIYKNPHFYGRLMKFVMEPNGLENDEQLLEYLNYVGYDGLLNTQGVGVLLATDIFLAYGLELASHSQRLSKPKRVTYQRYLAAWEIVRLWEQQQKRTDRRPDWIKEEIGTFLDPLPICCKPYGRTQRGWRICRTGDQRCAPWAGRRAGVHKGLHIKAQRTFQAECRFTRAHRYGADTWTVTAPLAPPA